MRAAEKFALWTMLGLISWFVALGILGCIVGVVGDLAGSWDGWVVDW